MIKLSAFRSRDFRLYIAGNAFALQAMWIHRIALAWLSWSLSGSASYVGWVAFLSFAPTLVTGPLFGVLVDRLPIRRAALQSQGALFALYLATAIFFDLGWLTLFVLPVIALGIGIVSSAHHPVRMSLAPLLVPRGDIASLVTATSLNFNLARTLGPAIGGLLIANYGVGPTLWVVVAAAIPYLVALPFLHPRERLSQSQVAGHSLADGFREGLSYALQTGFIREILLITGLFALIGRGMMEVLPLVADGTFERGAAGLGKIASALGIGALVASALLTLAHTPEPGQVPWRGRIGALMSVGFAVALATSPSWPLALAAAAALGATGTLVGVSMQAAMQPALPDDFRGRVMSFWVMTGIGSSALGALLIGVVADLVGLQLAVVGIGAVLAMALILLPRLCGAARETR